MDFSPAFVPVLSAAGMGVLVILTIIGNWWGNRRGRAASAAPPPITDVMIPNVSVADGQLIREQVRILRESNEHSDERRIFERATLDIFKENLILMRQCTEYLRESAASLDRIERNQNPPSPPPRR